MNLPYYTTHCVQSLRKTVLPRLREDSKEDGEFLETALDLWNSAPKFICPMNGIFFEDKNFMRYLPYFRLPFKAMVLEYPGTLGSYEGTGNPDVGISLMTVESTVDGVLGADCLVAYEDKSTKNWMIVPGLLFIPYGDPSGTTKEYMGNSTITAVMRNTAFKTWAKHKGIDPNYEPDRAKLLKTVGDVLQRECMSLLQMSVAMSCSNVKTEVKKAPKFINTKRKAKGESPLYEYHLLTVDTSHRNDRGDPQGGNHASPRQHLRRGHVRRYQSGLTIWINDMVVNRDAPGKIVKDYRIKA